MLPQAFRAAHLKLRAWLYRVQFCALLRIAEHSGLFDLRPEPGVSSGQAKENLLPEALPLPVPAAGDRVLQPAAVAGTERLPASGAGE